MSTSISLNAQHIQSLDLSPVRAVLENVPDRSAIAAGARQIRFEIDYPCEPNDPRELSEIPEVRLWFVCLDARYPWLLALLDKTSGELYRYTAMLVPHQFNRAEGIQYNPEALEIFVMSKMFVLSHWLQHQGIEGQSKLKAIAQTLGYELDSSFFQLLQQSEL